MDHNANDLSPLRLRSADAKQYSFAYRRLVRKRFRRECLIDDEEILVRSTVVVSKGPAGEKCGPHRFEVTRQDYLKIGSLELAGIVFSFGSAPPYRTKPAGERQRI